MSLMHRVSMSRSYSIPCRNALKRANLCWLLIFCWLLIVVAATESARAEFVRGSGVRVCADLAPEDVQSPFVLGGNVSIDSPWGDAIASGFCDGAAAAGVRLELRRYNEDFSKEQEYISQLIADHVDAILLPSLSDDASVHIFRLASEAGIKIVCVGVCLNARDTERYVSIFFESDNTELGYRAGAYLAHWVTTYPERVQLDSLGRVHLGIVHSGGDSVSFRRGRGFRDALTDAGLEWVEAVSLQGTGIEEAAQAVRQIVEGYPDVDLVWADNGENTIGSLEGLKSLNTPRSIYLFGTEMNAKTAAGLVAEDRILQAVSSQITYEMSRRAVRETVELLTAEQAGEWKPRYRHRILESRLYTREDREAIKAFLERNP